MQWTGEEGTVGILGLNTEAAPESLVGPDKKFLNECYSGGIGRERTDGRGEWELNKLPVSASITIRTLHVLVLKYP